MATKWKNTELSKDIWELILRGIKRDEFRLLPGVICAVLAAFCFSDLLHGRFYVTEETLTEGFFMNLSLGVGVWGLLGFLVRYRNRKWKPTHGEFYHEWKEKLKKQQIFFGLLFLVLLGAAVKHFHYVYTHAWKYANYSTGYVLVGTVILQWVLCEMVLLSYMKRKLEEYMAAMEQINQQNLEAALQSV